MITTNSHLEEHLDHESNRSDDTRERYHREMQDLETHILMERWYDNQCAAAEQMQLITYNDGVPVLDEYDAYWDRLEKYFNTYNEEIL